MTHWISCRLTLVLSVLSQSAKQQQKNNNMKFLVLFYFLVCVIHIFSCRETERHMWRRAPCWWVREATVHPADVELSQITVDPPVICPSFSGRRHLWSDKWDTFSLMIFNIWHTVLNRILWCLRGQNKDTRVPHLITDCGISFSLHREFNWKRLCDMVIKQDKPTQTHTPTHRQRESGSIVFPSFKIR